MITLTLAISHAPWVPGRKGSLLRLGAQLGIIEGPNGARAPTWVLEHVVNAEPGENHEWSETMWQWAVHPLRNYDGLPATHHLFLQDDVKVAPGFWSILHAMLEAVPSQILGLEAVHPQLRELAKAKQRWATTKDGLVGPGYVFPHKMLEEFLSWREENLHQGAVRAITEDTLIDVFALSTGRLIWHPIPTIIDHDISIRSSYGNDAHKHRRPVVRWDHGDRFGWTPKDLESPDFWTTQGKAVGSGVEVFVTPHLGRFYETTHRLAKKWVKGYPQELFEAAEEEVARARATSASARPRIFIATPRQPGDGCPENEVTVLKLLRSPFVDILDVKASKHDLVRIRSRLVRLCLEMKPKPTHLFWVDADVSFPPLVLQGMLDANKEFVAAPYPKKMTDWEEVDRRADDFRGHGAFTLEATAYRYPVVLTEDQTKGIIDETNCTEVAGMPLGCALIRVDALERIMASVRAQEERLGELLDNVEARFEECGIDEEQRADLAELRTRVGLEFDDFFQDDEKHPTSALFMLSLERRELWSEDHSFCRRWRKHGGKVWMYLGEGSPVTHHGWHTFKGHIEAFGLTRHREAAE